MFISKKLHNKIVRAKEDEIVTLEKELELQKLINADLRIENEGKSTKINNYKNVLLAIENESKNQQHNNICNFKNKIKSILKTAKSI